jgi:hypothetical protein
MYIFLQCFNSLHILTTQFLEPYDMAVSLRRFTEFCHQENFKPYNTVHIIKQMWDKTIYSTLWHIHNTPKEHKQKVTDRLTTTNTVSRHT